MDYSVGGPLWLEWQRLQSHSEWERWKDLYGGEQRPLVQYQVYYDWLLENHFPLEAAELVENVLQYSLHTMHNFDYPSFYSVSKDPDSEPVEGAA